MSFDCSITIPHGMSIAHTMSLNQNIKKKLFYNYTSWYEHSSYYELESKYQKNHKRIGCKKIIILEWFNSARKYIRIILGPKIFQPDLT